MKEAKSRRQLAAALKASESAVRKWLAHTAWSFGQDGPWNVEEVRTWREKTLGADPAAEDGKAASGKSGKPDKLAPERQVKLELSRERTRKLKFEREVAEGKYLPRSEVEAGRLARIETVKASLLGLPARLAAQLVGMNEQEIATVLEGEVLKILHQFSRDQTGAPRS